MQTSARDLLARMQDRVHALVLRRDDELWSERSKYTGTSKVIKSTPDHRRM